MSQYKNRKAVALKYDDSKEAPVIVASGLGYMAEKIVEVACQSGVPVFEDNSLASVLSQLELGVEIPEELYKAIVDIYVYLLSFVPTESNPLLNTLDQHFDLLIDENTATEPDEIL